MADYRLDCSNPACNYNGFNGHVDGCYNLAVSLQMAKERKQKQEQEDAEGRAYWSDLAQEQMFAELKTLEDEISTAEKLRIKRNYAYDILRDKYLIQKYFDYRKTH